MDTLFWKNNENEIRFWILDKLLDLVKSQKVLIVQYHLQKNARNKTFQKKKNNISCIFFSYPNEISSNI